MPTAALRRELDRLRRTIGGRKGPEPSPEERSRYAWYGEPSDVHPRARDAQRPPDGEWRTWFLCAGRAAGKTRSAAEWIRWRVESGRARRVHLIGATAADVRDVMVGGESGILAISPPWFRPTWEPSKRLLTWPNGAIALTFSSEEPDRLRGPQADTAWADELAAWPKGAAWDNLLLGLRLGADPRVCVSSTPKPTRLVRALLEDPATAVVKSTTYDNRDNLPAAFFDRIVSLYAGTRLGQQELLAELLETSEGAVWANFDPARHVAADAEYDPRFPVHLAVDCGVSRHTAAVFFQVRPFDRHRSRVCVFGDFHIEGAYAEQAAGLILDHARSLPCRGRLDTVRLDPAASARTGIGPAAYGAYEAAFGPRVTSRWPAHSVADGIDQVSLLVDQGLLILHPRCDKLKSAILNYTWKSRGGEFQDEPAQVHPYEDLADALRGGIRDRWPEGVKVPQPQYRQVPARGFGFI